MYDGIYSLASAYELCMVFSVFSTTSVARTVFGVFNDSSRARLYRDLEKKSR